jgi:ABC-2 type transport system permease protein
MIRIETLKAIRSRVPLFTVLGYMMLPLAAAFFIFILKDPVFAQKMGLISTKAHLQGNTADWPTYLSIFAQGIAAGGTVLSCVISSWVFGREFSDGTLKDMLAVPTPRLSILLAKFVLVAVWYVILSIAVVVFGLALGVAIGLPGVTNDLLLGSGIRLLITQGLVILVVTPFAFFASAGRGYLPPIGVMILVLALTNVVVVAGWGAYFPWAVPMLYSDAVKAATLEPASYWIVVLTGLAGIAATYAWWQTADQSR